MIKTVKVLECTKEDSLSGAPKKTWSSICETTLRLFEKTSTTIINSVEYSQADYVALAFKLDITKKNRIEIDQEQYSIESQTVMGTINLLLLKKVCIDGAK